MEDIIKMNYTLLKYIGKVFNMCHILLISIRGWQLSLVAFFVSSCLSTGDHIGRSTRNSNPVMTSSADGAMGCSDHRLF